MSLELIATEYEALGGEIVQIVEAGKARARQAVEREKVRTYWEIGRAIHGHLQGQLHRAEYGTAVALRLADDLGMSESLISNICNFYDKFKILHTSRELTWSHYLKLLPVANASVRRAYVKVAAQKGWSVRALGQAVKERWIERGGILLVTPGTEPMLNHWRGRVSMGVVSNYFMVDIHTPEKLLARYGLLNHFEFVLNSAEFGYKKPDKKIYLEALRLAELSEEQAGRVLFIGDTPQTDILMPKELGFQVLYLDRSADRPHRPVPDDISTITHWDQFRS